MSTVTAVLPLLILVVVLVAVLARTTQGAGDHDDRYVDGLSGENIDRDDERYWLGGIIYNNPDDPELLVPKRFGLGRTLNFGRPLGKVLTIGLLLVALVPLLIRLANRP
ncbi:MAG TPA: DUF5808 domain-containing protein [Thermomicrobiaceae bacterium]|nr:DUF5808 domain-containing protein [Thermomicrobiaceae bacterium]